MRGSPETIPAEFVTLDERFAGTGGDRRMTRVFAQGRWLEGPAYHPAGRFVLFSDIPNDRVLRYDEVTEQVTEFATGSGSPTGGRPTRSPASSPASTATDGSPGPSTTARPRCWPTPTPATG